MNGIFMFPARTFIQEMNVSSPVWLMVEWRGLTWRVFYEVVLVGGQHMVNVRQACTHSPVKFPLGTWQHMDDLSLRPHPTKARGVVLMLVVPKQVLQAGRWQEPGVLLITEPEQPLAMSAVQRNVFFCLLGSDSLRYICITIPSMHIE